MTACFSNSDTYNITWCGKTVNVGKTHGAYLLRLITILGSKDLPCIIQLRQVCAACIESKCAEFKLEDMDEVIKKNQETQIWAIRDV